MVTTEDQSIKELLDTLHIRRWSDAAIGKELGVSGPTVWRWRNDWNKTVSMEKMVRLALTDLLARP